MRGALARRWFERVLGRTPVSGRGAPVQLGSDYGGWMAPAALIESDWVCYCVGAGGDISFDRALIERFGVHVQSVEPVEQFVTEARAAMADEPRFAAYRAAISTEDRPLRMQRTQSPGALALSGAGLFASGEFVEVPGRELGGLMGELGHARIDLLKLDVEGAEYELLPSLDLDALGVKVLAVQLHHNRGVGAARSVISDLGRRGFEAVALKPAVKLTFARRDLLDAGGRRDPPDAGRREPPEAGETRG